MNRCNFGELADMCDVHKRGSSSFKMHDPEQLFNELGLCEGQVVLDLGCGPGDYSLTCARLVGEAGTVYALEKQVELLKDLKLRAETSGIHNIQTVVCDITEPLLLDDDCVDVCLVVTVLHDPAVSPHKDALFAEIHRVLKPDGRLVTIDVKKEEDASFGPPMHMRLAPEELENVAIRQRFEKVKMTSLGYNYMLQFKARKSR